MIVCKHEKTYESNSGEFWVCYRCGHYLHPGAQARDEAMQQVDDHADTSWKGKALAAVLHIAEHGDEVTTDEVWAALEKWYPHLRTHEPRAMGPVMRRAAGLGLIERTERTTLSVRPENHRRPVRVWRSLV